MVGLKLSRVSIPNRPFYSRPNKRVVPDNLCRFALSMTLPFPLSDIIALMVQSYGNDSFSILYNGRVMTSDRMG